MAEEKANRFMVIMSRHMMACDEASYLISRACDNRLSRWQRLRLKVHLLTCHFCRKYEHQLRELTRHMHVYRHTCDREECMHRLPEERKVEIHRVVNKALNANE